MQSSRHVGLVLFFALAALAGAVTGLVLQELEVGAHWVVSLSAVMTATVAFAGVFYHRLIVLRQKQIEVEDYLVRIEREHQKLRAVLEGSTELVLVLDPEDRIVEASRLARELLSLAPGDVWQPRGAPLECERLSAALVRARAGETAALDGLELDVAVDPATPGAPGSVAAAGGKRLVCDLRAAGLATAAGESLLFVALRDVSAQQRMERELKLRERLSSLGLLTAGVAHEINNPLEGIGNYLSLLSRTGVDDETRERWLGEVRHGFERIRDLVRNLLLFARPNQTSAPVDLARTVNRALAATRSTRRMSGVEVERSGLEPPIYVAGEAARLEQVLINLLLNAGSALEGGGLVRVSAQPEEGDGGEPFVRVVVEDDGPGIPADVRERVFDPFFSTGEGTGLGLAISYGIVQAHDGTIELDDSPLGGARFTLRLRGADPPSSPPTSSPDSLLGSPLGSRLSREAPSPSEPDPHAS